MASPAFRHAFERFKNIEDIPASLKSIVVKIIELDAKKKMDWERSEFWQGLKAESISISFLSSPCVLETRARNSSGRYHIMQSEIKHLFTEQCWPNVLAEPVTGAIIISHLRALNEALHELNQKPGVIMILEGDVSPTKNALVLFAEFLANILGNVHLRDNVCTALTFSEWHVGYANKVHRVANKLIPDSKHGPYFQMCSLPVQSENDGQYQFVGQGGRALSFRSSWAEELLSNKVSFYYDIWLINELSNKRTLWHKKGYDTSALATLCIPSISNTPPIWKNDFVAQADSQRLQQMRQKKAHITSAWICLAIGVFAIAFKPSC